jgi:NhaP-type Na+/H+ or K+/H+ antiporter
LFEGGLSLRFSEIRDTGKVVLRLVSIGLGITAVLTTLAARYFLNLSWEISLIIGALLTVSGPTVIVPLIRQVRPTKRIGSLIKWEGIVNDPIGAVLAALVFEVVAGHTSGDVAFASLRGLGTTLVVGLGLGIVSGWMLVLAMRNFLVPDFLQNPVFLSVVLLVFALSNSIQSESGLVTVTVLGVYLANQTSVTVKHVIEFKENLRVLLISVLFIVLASRTEVSFANLAELGWGLPLFLVSMLLVVRPLSVFVATLGSDLTRNERVLLACVHPRGIVAAAVATLFAIDLAKQFPNMQADADKLVLVTILTVVTTVTVYGLTLGPLSRWLGLSRENPQGVLFAGASNVVREIALAVKSEGFPVLVVDTNPSNIAAARMAGLPVCYASIGSEFVLQETDLGEIGRLLAMTPNDEVNALAATELSQEFGRANCYQLAPPERGNQRHERVPHHLRGRLLFNKKITAEQLRDRFEDGARIKKTTLSDDYTYADFLAKFGDSAVLMFVISDKSRLLVCATDTKTEPKKGDKLIAMVDPREGVSESGINLG